MARTLITGVGWLLMALAPAVATAAPWRADQDSGELTFIATQAGARFHGHFDRFTLVFDFDPAAPQLGQLRVTIATASAQTADVERDQLLQGRDFFWTARFPEATYTATGFRRHGRDGWLVNGELTLRGVTQPVELRFALETAADLPRMRGGATLRRLEFGIGQGDWASTVWIGDSVEVRFDLRLRPAPVAASP